MKVNKINIVTLGCSKNVVDSEVLMYQLKRNGWQVVHNSNDPSAKVVVINTCGFIGDAKEEAIDTIFDFIKAKNAGVIDKVFVIGCLVERYREELKKDIPEVDGVYGVAELPSILNGLNSQYFEDSTTRRELTTPKHYAYLKISEGCNWGCSYCAIPMIRGKHISRSMESLVEEATILANGGAKELILIAQDLTYYGLDLYKRRTIAELVQKLSQIEGIEWIRLHYAYPAHFPEDLIDVIASNPKVCKYLDIPLQHINSEMLHLMRRGIDREQTIELVDKLREKIPDIAIRTTFIVGHPGETDEKFDELLKFVTEYKFDRVGVFPYFHEEGTFAGENFSDDIPEEVKQKRADVLMERQMEISLDNNRGKIGKVIRVIIDSVDNDQAICRTQWDSPEVDQEVIVSIPSGKSLIQGSFINVKITSAQEYELYAELA